MKNITFLFTFFLFFVFSHETYSQAPADENYSGNAFDGALIPTTTSGRTVDGITYTTSKAGVQVTANSVIANSGGSELGTLFFPIGNARFMSLDYTLLAVLTEVGFKSSTGNSFKLVSLDASVFTGSAGVRTENFIIKGYDAGDTEVATDNVDFTTSDAAGSITYTKDASGAESGTLTFNGDWENIVRVAFIGTDAGVGTTNGVSIAFDNFDFATAVVVAPCVESNTNVSNTNTATGDLGQSFVADCSGTLGSIELQWLAADASFSVDVYNGAGTGGVQVGSTVSGLASVGSGLGSFETFDLSSGGIILISGQTYTFDVKGAANIYYDQSGGASVSDGFLYFNGGAQSALDMIYKVNISAADVTAPVFENSTPSATSIAGTSFTLNTDINEGGTIYYVIVANGASAPTSAEVKAGTASGGGAAIKSANATVNSGGFTNTFSVTGLTSQVAYDVYVVAEDDAGSPNLQTSPIKVDVTTTDITAPVFENSTPSAASIVGTSFILNTDVNEGGTIYYVIVTNGASAPTSVEVKAGIASGGGAALKSANATVNSGGFTNAFSVTGLTSETAYDVYVVAEDDAGIPNLQTSPIKVDVTTTDITAPVFENSTPSAASIVGTSFILNTDVNEGGTIYYVIVANGASAPTSVEVKAGIASGGGAALKSANATVNSGGFTNAFSVTGLTSQVAYDVYVVAEDDAGIPNLQNSPTKIDVTTEAPLSVVVTKNDVSSSGALDGSITVNATGGLFPYSYAWSNGATTSTITGLVAGAYTYWVTDDIGTVVTSVIQIVVADTTAPVFENSTPSAASIAGTSFTLNTDINEGGTIYYVIVSNGASAPTSAEVKAGTASDGGAALKSANATVSSGGFTNAFSVTGLTYATAYDVYVVAEDDAGSPNLQTSPTKIDVNSAALLSATKIDALMIDNDFNGELNAGETIRYTVVISNPDVDATLVMYNVTPDANSTLVVGSVTTNQGTIFLGNTLGNTGVSISLGTIAAGGSVTITYDVLINNPFSGGSQISAQGTITGSNFSDVLTDDPGIAGIADATVSIVSDNTVPTLSSSNPSDGSTGAVLSQNIVLTFNENISKGTGNILIKKTSDNSTIEMIDVTTAAVTVSTTTATINPFSDFDLNTGYYIQIDNTAFKDAANNNYAGIADATSLNFTSESNQTNSYTLASGSWSVPSNWSLGRLPISTDNVNVATNTINLDISNVTVNDLSVSIGGAFNLLGNSSITINGNLNQNGTVNILSNASTNGSLIVKGNHTGISNVDYHRYLSTSWHLISAPISGRNISTFSGNVNTSGNKYAIAPYENNVVSASRWNYYTGATGAGTGANPLTTAGTFTTGKGYSMQKNTGGTLNFSGTLNTTDKTFPITDGGDNPAGNRWNLVGNPYTASLNASNAADATNNFLKVNIDAGNLDPSRAGLYLWNGTAYVEKSVDDAAFYIAPGQGFFVHAPDAGGTSVSFTEAMETHQIGNVFLRGSGVNYPEIVLNITEDKNSSSTKIRYINSKTKGLDPGSDVGTFTGTNSNFKVFSHLVGNSKGIDFAIQALPNQDYETTVVPVGLKAKAGKTVVFSAETSNLPNGIEMYLEDRDNNVFTNLSKEDYTITLKTDTNSIGQFYIHTSAKNPEDINVIQDLENVSIYKSANNSLTIAGLQADKASVNVYSILGKKVISTELKSIGVHVVQLPKTAAGVYIVELSSSLGKVSKKIILE